MLIWGSRVRHVELASGQFHCLNCHTVRPYKRKRVAKYFTIYYIALFQLQDFGQFVECQVCHQTFKPEVLNFPMWRVVKIELTDKSELYLGDPEVRLIDNSRSEISVTRRFTVSKEWSQSYTIEYEKMRSSSKGAEIQLGDPVGIRASVDNSLKSRFAVSGESKRVHTEEVSIEVPAKKKVSVLTHWKSIWQNGIVTLRNQQNIDIEIPFRVLHGVNFDQSQVDAN